MKKSEDGEKHQSGRKMENKKYLLGIVSLFVVSRIVSGVLGMMSYRLILPLNRNRYVWHHTENKILDLWSVWDSGHYLDIAVNGYSTKPSQPNYAFFPLYPVLIRLVNKIFQNWVFSGLLISNLSLFLAGLFLYQLVNLDFSGEVSFRAVKFLFFFPTAFVFTSLYTESLFLFLTLAGFYFLRMNKIGLAALGGFLSSLTRPTGFLLSLPLGIELLQTHRAKIRNLVIISLIVLGIVFYSFYVKSLTGDFLAFLKAQKDWGRTFRNPLALLWHGIRAESVPYQFASWFTIGLLILLGLSFFYLRRSYFIYAAYTLLIPLLTDTASMPRFALVVFPFFILLAKLAEKKIVLDTLIIYSFLLLQGVMLVFWVNGFDLLM